MGCRSLGFQSLSSSFHTFRSPILHSGPSQDTEEGLAQLTGTWAVDPPHQPSRVTVSGRRDGLILAPHGSSSDQPRGIQTGPLAVILIWGWGVKHKQEKQLQSPRDSFRVCCTSRQP